MTEDNEQPDDDEIVEGIIEPDGVENGVFDLDPDPSPHGIEPSGDRWDVDPTVHLIRRPDESLDSYAVFSQAANNPMRRTTKQIAEDSGFAISTIRQWRSKFDWAARWVGFDTDVAVLVTRERVHRLSAAQGQLDDVMTGLVTKLATAVEHMNPEDLAASPANVDRFMRTATTYLVQRNPGSATPLVAEETVAGELGPGQATDCAADSTLEALLDEMIVATGSELRSTLADRVAAG
jgi:hypothetical protein